MGGFVCVVSKWKTWPFLYTACSLTHMQLRVNEQIYGTDKLRLCRGLVRVSVNNCQSVSETEIGLLMTETENGIKRVMSVLFYYCWYIIIVFISI